MPPTASAPPDFFDYIDQNVDSVLIPKLTKAVSFPSVSADLALRKSVNAMASWLVEELGAVGVTDVRRVELGDEPGTNPPVALPPAVLGRTGNRDPRKKTVLVYCHYDVQPAHKEDGWDTEDPFVLTPQEDRLVGRGATDDKGPIVGWLAVLRYHQEKQKELPVNLVFCFEGMEESSDGGALDKLVEAESKPGGWFNGVNAACVADNWWLTTTRPTLTYGVRGIAYFSIAVSGPSQDLHSGDFGGAVFEPMTELVYLLSNLVDAHGKILIPGVGADVAPPDLDERAIYERLDYNISDIEEAVGAPITLPGDKVDVLMGKMRNPCVSIHGIEGAWSGSGAKTVIPAKVIGKFSIRLVPPQTPEEVTEQVKQHILDLHKGLDSKLPVPVVERLNEALPWVANWDDWNFEAGKNAVEVVYGMAPDLTREGGSIPITVTFSRCIQGASVIGLSMGRGDDRAHSTNEKLNRDNFIKGAKFYGEYMYGVAKMV